MQKATVEQLWDFFVWLNQQPIIGVYDLTDDSLEIDASLTKDILREYVDAANSDEGKTLEEARLTYKCTNCGSLLLTLDDAVNCCVIVEKIPLRDDFERMKKQIHFNMFGKKF